MANNSMQSDPVIERYKRHKLGVSAIHYAGRLLQDDVRVTRSNRRLAAMVGVILMLLLTCVCMYRLGHNDITIAPQMPFMLPSVALS